MILFDSHHDAAALLSAGYEHRHHPEYWRDTGNAERGLKLIGHRAFDSYTLNCGDRSHEIIVEDGVVIYMDYVFEMPAGVDHLF